MNDLEKRLREDFRRALRCNPCGDVVDDLLNIIRKDYVLLVREPLYCHNCLHYSDRSGWIAPAYCVYYQRRIYNSDAANTCSHFFSGKEEARKTMARMHNELTDELIYDDRG